MPARIHILFVLVIVSVEIICANHLDFLKTKYEDDLHESELDNYINKVLLSKRSGVMNVGNAKHNEEDTGIDHEIYDEIQVNQMATEIFLELIAQLDFQRLEETEKMNQNIKNLMMGLDVPKTNNPRF